MVAQLDQPPAFLTDLRGLSPDAVAERRAAGAVNSAARPISRSYRRLVTQNLFTFLNLLIFAISGVLAALGLYVDALFACMLGLINAVVAIVQEARAKRTLDRIAVLTSPDVHVIRDGREIPLHRTEVVRDDLVALRPGGQIVVDGPVVSAANLSVDESLLTGESEPIAKTAGDTLYAGSYCMSGAAVYRAERVGAESTAEQINAEARSFRIVRTPLQREIIALMRVLLVAILLLTLVVLGTFSRLSQGLLSDGTVIQDAARAIAVLIGLVPQGLVLMISITYAIAVIRLARQGVLAHRTNAVESLSHVDVLCLDKTGTITTNHLTLQALHPIDVSLDALQQALGDVVTSATTGNRTAAAIGAACPGRSLPVREEAPFSSDRKWSGVIFDECERGAYVLGAPDVLDAAIVPGMVPDGALLDGWAAEGLRVLMLAHDPDAHTFGDPRQPRLPDHLIPLGLIALGDELRPDARETLRRFADAGIGLKIISGDHPATVTTLARQAGIEVADDGAVCNGQDLEGLDGDGYERAVNRATIFARITPVQKQNLVSALQRRGRYVAMVGDGVNDVRALKQADVAVAMRSGSDVARGAADIVLLDDAFTVLPATFREGQRIRNGLTATLNLFLTRTVYTMLIIFATALSGAVFPVALRHGALVSALTVGIPAFALALWARPGTVERRALPGVIDTVLPAGVTIAVAGLVVYRAFLTATDDVTFAQAALTTVTMLCGITLIPFLRPPAPAWSGAAEVAGTRWPVLLAVAMLIAYLAVLYLPPLQTFFELEPLPVSAYLLIAMVVPGWAVTVRLIWRFRLVPRLRRLSVVIWRRTIARLPRRLGSATHPG